MDDDMDSLIGHNSLGRDGEIEKPAAEQLRLFIERIERLEEEKKGIADDIKDVYSEAKSSGFDSKIMRLIIRERKMAADDRAEMQAILETYRVALGLI
jgi:uncharacterized protein (UPF0335 family)